MMLKTALTFTKRQNFKLVYIENMFRRQNKCEWKSHIYFWNCKKYCGKRRKCCLAAFSPFPTMFSKGFLNRVVESRDCFGKELTNKQNIKIKTALDIIS